jgi:chromosome segregation ATPase
LPERHQTLYTAAILEKGVNMNFDLISFLIGAMVAVALGWWLGSSSTTRQLRELQDTKRKLEEERQKTAQKLEQALVAAQGSSQVQSRLEGELSALKTRLPKLEGFERANADLRLQLQGFDTVKQKLQSAEQELYGLRPKAADFDALSQKLEAVQQEFSQHKSRTAGFEGISAKAAQASELEGKVALLEQQKAKHLGELSQMAVKVSDAEIAQSKLRQSLDSSLLEIKNLRDGIKAFAALEQRVAEVDALGISPEAQAKIGGLETELSAYQKRVAQLEERLQKIPELEAQIRRMSAPESVVVASEPVVEVITPEPVIEVVVAEASHLETHIPELESTQAEPATQEVQAVLEPVSQADDSQTNV